MNAEALWQLADTPALWSRWVGALGGITSVVGKNLLVEIPAVKAATA